MAPLSTMLSLPESSGLKPAPISISGATLPRTATRPGGRRIDPRQQPQKGALAGPVSADDPDSLPLVDLQADVAEGPEFRFWRRGVPAKDQVEPRPA